MSEVVGSTPSLTRKGRPSASLSRNSFTLMMCAAPCSNNARASSRCMIQSQNNAPASARRALLVLVQQLANLIDRERRVLLVERLLTFAFVQERPRPGVCARGNLFAGLRSVADAARGLICVSKPGICRSLL